MRITSPAQILGAFCLSIFLFACQKGGTGIATDKVEDSKCPAAGCASLTAEQSQLSIKGPAQTTIYQAATVSGSGYDFVEVGGECYPSTYADNRLEFKLYSGSSQISLASTDIVSIKPTTTGLPRCVGGKYGVAINGARMPAGAIYRLHAEIVAIDTTATEYRNSGTGYFDVNISR